MELILNKSILPYILILRYIEKDEQKAKKDMDANPPRGDGEWTRKSLFKNYFYYQWLQYQQTNMMPLDSYIE